MPRKTPTSWPEIAAETMFLGMEASSVIWLRSMRLMAGGRSAEREARRMVEEKLVAGAMLGPALMAKGTTDAMTATAATLAHFGKPVRANRRRLSRPRR